MQLQKIKNKTKQMGTQCNLSFLQKLFANFHVIAKWYVGNSNVFTCDQFFIIIFKIIEWENKVGE